MDQHALIIVAVAAVVFALFWLAIVVMVSVLSGWSSLAAHYKSEQVFTGRWRSIRRARLGFASYKGGALRAGVDPMGIHLATMALFRPGHAPLFIPWSDVRYEVVDGMFGRSGALTFMRAPTVKLLVTEADAHALFEARARGGLD